MGPRERSSGIGLLAPESISKTDAPISKLPTPKKRNQKKKYYSTVSLARIYYFDCLGEDSH